MPLNLGWCDQQGCFVTGSTGVTRPATDAEAGVIRGIGGYGYIEAPDTTPAPGGPPPAPISPTLGGAPTPSPDPTSPPSRQPVDDSWRREDQYRQIYRRQGQGVRGSYFQTPAGGTPRLDEGFWNSPEGMAQGYAHFVGQEADPNSHYGRWLANQYNRVSSEFKYANAFDKALRFGDFVDNRAKGLANEYLQLRGIEQGKEAPAWFAGRRG